MSDNVMSLTVEINDNQANAALGGLNKSVSVFENHITSSTKSMSGSWHDYAQNTTRAHERSRREIKEASEAAHLLGREIGIELPRAVRRFIGESQVLGTVLTSAFTFGVYVAAGQALISWISEAGEKFGWWGDEAEKAAKKSAESIRSLTDEIRRLHNETMLLGTGGMNKIVTEISQSAEAQKIAIERLKEASREHQDLATRRSDQTEFFKNVEPTGGLAKIAQWIAGTGQDKLDKASGVVQTAVLEKLKADKILLERGQELRAAQFKKDIDLQTSFMNARLKDKDIANFTLQIKQQEQAKDEAMANLEEKGVLSAERKLIHLRAQLQVAESLYEINKNWATEKPGISESAQAKFREARESYSGPTPPTFEGYLAQIRAEANETSSQRSIADKMNYETGKMEIDRQEKRLQMEGSLAKQIQASGSKEKEFLEMRRADQVYHIELKQEELLLKRQILEIDQQEFEAVKNSPIGEWEELKTAFAARRAQLIKNSEDESGLLRMKRDKEIEDAHAEYAISRIKDIRDAAGHIFDDLLSGSKNTWKSMLDSFKNIFLAPVRIAFQDLAASLFGGSRRQAPAGGAAGMLSLPSFFGGGGSSNPGGGAELQKVMQGGEVQSVSPVANRGGIGGMLSSFGGLKLGSTGLSSLAMPIISGFLAAGGMLKNPGAKGGLYAMAGMTGISALAAAGIGGNAMAALATSLTIPVIGGIIAAGVGIGALIGFLHKSAEEKAREKVRNTYGVDIKSKGVLKQIVEIARQSYGGDLDMCIRTQQVSDLVRLYAMATAQSLSKLPKQMAPSTLLQNASGLYQQTAYSNGSAIPTYGSLPGSGLDSIGAGISSNAAPITVISQIAVPDVKKFLEQGYAETIDNNPRIVQNASMKANKANYNRRNLTTLQLSPFSLNS